jgi:ectoine hydroxylase-related dioxygenase (phytanoyl-CoA dioxygenase family)
MGIKHFDCNAKTPDIVAALDRDGAVLVTGLADPAIVTATGDELSERCEQQSRPAPFTSLPENELFAASRSVVELVGHARVLSVARAELLRHASDYQLGTANAVLIRSGADEQDLKADATAYPLRVPGMEWHINAVWALDDVAADTGAPTLIPGSHRMDIMRLPDVNDRVPVPMPRGAVLFCSGWTLRGWSGNRSARSSLFLVSRYSLGWLRAEVNHLLTIPGEISAGFPEPLRRLLGYASYEHGRLGWHPREPGTGPKA